MIITPLALDALCSCDQQCSNSAICCNGRCHRPPGASCGGDGTGGACCGGSCTLPGVINGGNGDCN
jgi:hypothetical protein